MIRYVENFRDLVATPFRDGVNAICWRRGLGGDFAGVVAGLGAGEGIVRLEKGQLPALRLSGVGRIAVDCMLDDVRMLRAQAFAPELNCVYGYPRDEETFPTDVYSFHADRAPVAAETWLCTYHGAASEGLRNEDARRRVDVPEIRA